MTESKNFAKHIYSYLGLQCSRLAHLLSFILILMLSQMSQIALAQSTVESAEKVLEAVQATAPINEVEETIESIEAVSGTLSATSVGLSNPLQSAAATSFLLLNDKESVLLGGGKQLSQLGLSSTGKYLSTHVLTADAASGRPSMQQLHLQGLPGGYVSYSYEGLPLPLSALPTYGGQQASSMHYLPRIGLSSLEILTGGWSAIHGSGAITGAVNLNLDQKKRGVFFQLNDTLSGEETTNYTGIAAHLGSWKNSVLISYDTENTTELPLLESSDLSDFHSANPKYYTSNANAFGAYNFFVDESGDSTFSYDFYTGADSDTANGITFTGVADLPGFSRDLNLRFLVNELTCDAVGVEGDDGECHARYLANAQKRASDDIERGLFDMTVSTGGGTGSLRIFLSHKNEQRQYRDAPVDVRYAGPGAGYAGLDQTLLGENTDTSLLTTAYQSYLFESFADNIGEVPTRNFYLTRDEIVIDDATDEQIAAADAEARAYFLTGIDSPTTTQTDAAQAAQLSLSDDYEDTVDLTLATFLAQTQSRWTYDGSFSLLIHTSVYQTENASTAGFDYVSASREEGKSFRTYLVRNNSNGREVRFDLRQDQLLPAFDPDVADEDCTDTRATDDTTDLGASCLDALELLTTSEYPNAFSQRIVSRQLEVYEQGSVWDRPIGALAGGDIQLRYGYTASLESFTQNVPTVAARGVCTDYWDDGYDATSDDSCATPWGNFAGLASIDAGEGDRTILAGFLEFQIPFSEDVQLQANLRSEQVSGDAGDTSNFSYSMLGNWQLGHAISVQAQLARSARNPSWYQSFANSSKRVYSETVGDYVVVANNPLTASTANPEYSDDVGLWFNYRWKSTLVRAQWWQKSISDAIVQVPAESLILEYVQDATAAAPLVVALTDAQVSSAYDNDYRDLTNAARNIVAVQSPVIQLDSFDLSGIEVGIHTSISSGNAEVAFGIDVSWVDSAEISGYNLGDLQYQATDVVNSLNRTNPAPAIAEQSSVAYASVRYGKHNLRLTQTTIGSVRDDLLDTSIGDYTTLDIDYKWRVPGNNGAWGLSVLNATDEAAPVVQNRFGFSSNLHHGREREVRFSFEYDID